MKYLSFFVFVTIVSFAVGTLFLLDFDTKSDKVEVQVQQNEDARLNQAKAYFNQLSTETSSGYAEAVLQDFILKVVADEVATWNELGFTEAQVQQKVNDVRLNQAKAYFKRLSTETVPNDLKVIFQKSILKVVADEVATWNELGFTEDQLRQRMNEVYVHQLNN